MDGAKLGHGDRTTPTASRRPCPRPAPTSRPSLHDARSLAAKLNASADKIDAVLNGAQGFLGSASGQEGSSTFA